MLADAIVFTGIREVEIRKVEVPVPGPAEVQVEVRAAGVCRMETSIFGGVEDYGFPYLGGHEAAGIVVDVGPGVTKFAPGDKVAGVCSYQSVVNVRESRLARIPDDIGDFGAWLIEPVSCVANAIDFLHLGVCDRIALIGDGFMGLLFAQALSRTLASEVVVVGHHDDRLELALGFGADVVVNSRSQCVKDLFAKRKFDVVVEVAGTSESLDLATKALRRSGTLGIFAWHHGKMTVDGGAWHLSGFQVMNLSPRINPHFYPTYLEKAVILMEKGLVELTQLITHRTPFREAQQLMTAATDTRNQYIKGILTF